MDKESGKREIEYQATMAAARAMLCRGIITEEAYRAFEVKMRQKYSPETGTLLSSLDLI